MPRTRRPFQPEDLYLIRTVFDPQVSPDGRSVAYVVSWPDREGDETQSAVYVAPIDGKEPARQFSQGVKDHSPRWSPDGKYLAFVSGRAEKNQVFLAPLVGGEARQLTNAKWGVSQPAWSPDGTRIAYSARGGDFTEPKERKGAEKNAPRVVRNLRYKLDGVGFFDERRMHIFVADAERGAETQLTSGDYFDDQPSWSPDGRTVAFVSDRERQRHDRQWRTDVWAVPAKGGDPVKLTRSLGSASHPAYAPDGRHIAFVGHEAGDEGLAKNIHLMVIPAKGGAAPRSLTAGLDRPAAGWPAFAAGRAFEWAGDSSSVFFLGGDRGTQAIYNAPLKGQARKVLDGERQIEAFALAPSGKAAAFTAVWPNAPWEVYSAGLGRDTREINLSHANTELHAQVELVGVERMTYPASDGLEIEAFVLYPRGYRPGRRYPLAINVHGGPHSFHPGARSLVEYQSLAANGYVVLLPNPRGSTTYGEAFTEACVRDWGGADFEDIMTGADVLIERGIVDPDRMCIGGYSYGGFMASWAVGHTSRFKAALVGAPVSNQASMFGTGDIPLFDMHEIGGLPQHNADEYAARSPVTYLGNVTTPVLLVHHEGDLRCPIAQSEEIFHALRAMGKKVEFVRYPSGFHTYNTHAPSQALDRITRTVAWFDRYAGKPSSSRAARTRKKARERV